MKKDPRDRIPSSDLTAYERWELPLLDARGNEVWVRDEDLDLKPLTAQDIEDIRQAAMEDGAREGREAAYKEGFEAGRAEGHKAGLESGRVAGEKAGREQGQAAREAEIEAALQRLQTLMAELLDPLERHTENLETALLNLTLSLARAVIHRELKLDSSQIRAVLKEAVAALPNIDDLIRIHVNPVDAEWAREAAARLENESRIVEDESVLQGGCRVETRNSLVDFTVEKRFQKAVQAMLDRQIHATASAESADLGALVSEMTDFDRQLLERAPEPEPTTTTISESESTAAPASDAADPKAPVHREPPSDGDNDEPSN